jgi:diaminopimelate epimerase
MRITFSKYQGTGNDFILVDNRDGAISLTTAQVAQLCHRRFGIGADGLMLLELADGYDFRMAYYNSDGNESTMCGNGGRCIAAFASRLGVVRDKANFIAVDGPHMADIHSNGDVALQMRDVADIALNESYCELNTGSPHYVAFVSDAEAADVVHTGRAIRNSDRYAPKGINVNFVQRMNNGMLYVRTYERGVEDETYSCGTGVTAAAIAAASNATGSFNTAIRTPGGDLTVTFTKISPTVAQHVILKGNAVHVYDGVVDIL